MLLLLFALTAFTLNAAIYLPEGITLEQVKESPKEIAWDIHNVLAQKEPSRLGKAMAETKKYALAFAYNPGAIVSGLYNWAYSAITGKPTPTSLALYDMKNLPKAIDSSGEAYVTICKKHNLTGLAKFIEYISNAYRPRPGMKELVSAIKEHGIIERFASNIGPCLFESLNKKFHDVYKSNLLDLIALGKFVDYSKYGKEPVAIPGEHLTNMGKPSWEFFEDYSNTYNSKRDHFIIFIDDKLQSVKQSISHPEYKFIGIHFDLTVKNPMVELRHDLAQLGIAS